MRIPFMHYSLNFFLHFPPSASSFPPQVKYKNYKPFSLREKPLCLKSALAILLSPSSRAHAAFLGIFHSLMLYSCFPEKKGSFATASERKMINAPADALASRGRSVVHAHSASAKMPLMSRHIHTPWRDECMRWDASVCWLHIHVLIAACCRRLIWQAARAQFTFYAPRCTPARGKGWREEMKKDSPWGMQVP